MKIVEPSICILPSSLSGYGAVCQIEEIARTCYKSEKKNTSLGETIQFVSGLIQRGHTAMLEHISVTVKFVVDRGVSHELVRHRIGSYAQESTRFCNYSKERFGKEISVIEMGPHFKNPASLEVWLDACKHAEQAYFKLLELGESPQIARAVLPTCTKTEINATFNLREWRHVFALRELGVTGQPHPQMKEVMTPLLTEMKRKFLVIFDDL